MGNIEISGWIHTKSLKKKSINEGKMGKILVASLAKILRNLVKSLKRTTFYRGTLKIVKIGNIEMKA